MRSLDATQPQAAPAGKPSALVVLGSLYLGLAFALPNHVNRETPFFSIALVVAFALSSVGWRHIEWFGFMHQYIFWGVVFAGWFSLAAIALWEPSSLYLAITMGVWLLFVIPGLAGLWRNETVRWAFIVGAVVGVLVYGITAAVRLASGDPVRDVTVDGEVGAAILGLNRNAVNVRALLVFPFLMAWDPGHRRVALRWIALSVVALWIVTSGGRSGIVAAAMVLTLYVLLQPGISGRVRTAGVAAMLAVTAFFAIQQAGGPAAESTNRLMEAVRGERTSSDEVRELAARKAWHMGMDNPVFGLGPRNTLARTYHPVIDEGPTLRVRHRAFLANAHNTYAEVLAMTGIPGIATFVLLLGSVLLIGIRRSADKDVRVATSALGGVLTVIYFHSSLGSPIFYAVVLVLSTALASGRRRERKAVSSEQGVRA